MFSCLHAIQAQLQTSSSPLPSLYQEGGKGSEQSLFLVQSSNHSEKCDVRDLNFIYFVYIPHLEGHGCTWDTPNECVSVGMIQQSVVRIYRSIIISTGWLQLALMLAKEPALNKEIIITLIIIITIYYHHYYYYYIASGIHSFSNLALKKNFCAPECWISKKDKHLVDSSVLTF